MAIGLGWKKFSFFEQDDRPGVAIPEETTCSSGSQHHIAFGCSGGQVVLFERAFTGQLAFQAHGHLVTQLICLKDHPVLMSLGQEDASLASTTLKVWNLEGMQVGSPPPLLRNLKPFAANQKMPEAAITCISVHEASWPRFTVAVGLATSQIYILRGGSGKERLQRSVLHMREGAAGEELVGLAFKGADADLYLYAVTHAQTAVFNMTVASKSLLDEMGAEKDCTTLNPEGDLVVARPEAVYFYSVDGRGPCFVFEGQKRQLRWLRHYLASVTTSILPRAVTTTALHVYDLRNKLVAASVTLPQDPRHIETAWGSVVVVRHDGSVAVLHEKALSAKLELLYSKSLFLVALNLAQSEEAEPSAVAEIQRRYGDHLYAKHDYDAAMTQYVATIGHMEPSYVIRKFLDAQRIHNLTSYLEELHVQKLAGADHTTLLLNCYTKLKDVSKLDAFLRGSGASEGSSALPFDAETAVKVCRTAGYYEHALYVAQAAKEPEWYLDILLEDCQQFDEALAYLQDLPRQQAAAALTRHGKSLINSRPEATTALLMQLCTDMGDSSKADSDWVAKIGDFAHLYTDRPQALMLLCEYVLNSTRAPPSEALLFHTLLQLYLADDLPEEQDEQSMAATSETTRREQALELLKRGWPPGDEPRYDPDHALMLCRMAGFKLGLIFLYENLRLFREVLQVLMAAGDHAGLIEACARLGDVSRGGDPHLWTEVLQYFGSQQYDCSAQVREVLAHIEAGALLPPLVVLQTLAKNPQLKLSVVKDYAARTLSAEGAAVEEDRKAISRFQEETASMRAEITELKTKVRVFQNNRCALSGSSLELPAVHFLCGHSFNARSLGENERECPLCAPQFRTILEIRRSLRAGAAEQDKFFTQLRNSADGFNVIADFFGRGILNSPAATSS
ncbi:g11315 [Coccomyxa viridis]|uniref:Vacuolar protein sorting-associated protein 11 homolog n=1 Tax=Coccomyxa viridis TaxID=1274662 RepID=A0ABP1GAC3_9CHLO